MSSTGDLIVGKNVLSTENIKCTSTELSPNHGVEINNRLTVGQFLNTQTGDIDDTRKEFLMFANKSKSFVDFRLYGTPTDVDNNLQFQSNGQTVVLQGAQVFTISPEADGTIVLPPTTQLLAIRSENAE